MVMNYDSKLLNVLIIKLLLRSYIHQYHKIGRYRVQQLLVHFQDRYTNTEYFLHCNKKKRYLDFRF